MNFVIVDCPRVNRKAQPNTNTDYIKYISGFVSTHQYDNRLAPHCSRPRTAFALV